MLGRSSGTASSWLGDPLFDLSFILGIALLAGLMSGMTVLWPALLFPIVAAHAWLLGMSTFSPPTPGSCGIPMIARHRRLIL